MRIAIVNDSIIEIEVLKRLLAKMDNCSLTWTAQNGLEAVERCKSDRPDMILMNLIMPVMDGVEATKIIMQNNPTAILLLTASMTIHQSKVFEAMGYGALDVTYVPIVDNFGNLSGSDDLKKKIEMFSKLTKYAESYDKSIKKTESTSTITYPKLVVIGSSTGGPKVLATFLTNLQKNINGTIVIVQHVDIQFTIGLVDWLNTFSKNPVIHAKSGDNPQKGNIYVAGGNEHLILNSTQKFEYTNDPENYHYRPSVDVFFQSVSKNWKNRGLAILITGMGNDGAKGLLELRKNGWLTIGQDEASSVIYGMPKAAAEIGAAQKILNVEQISEEINVFLK
jgi:two-component system response regulator WspF